MHRRSPPKAIGVPAAVAAPRATIPSCDSVRATACMLSGREHAGTSLTGPQSAIGTRVRLRPQHRILDISKGELFSACCLRPTTRQLLDLRHDGRKKTPPPESQAHMHEITGAGAWRTRDWPIAEVRSFPFRSTRFHTCYGKSDHPSSSAAWDSRSRPRSLIIRTFFRTRAHKYILRKITASGACDVLPRCLSIAQTSKQVIRQISIQIPQKTVDGHVRACRWWGAGWVGAKRITSPHSSSGNTGSGVTLALLWIGLERKIGEHRGQTTWARCPIERIDLTAKVYARTPPSRSRMRSIPNCNRRYS